MSGCEKSASTHKRLHAYTHREVLMNKQGEVKTITRKDDTQFKKGPVVKK